MGAGAAAARPDVQRMTDMQFLAAGVSALDGSHEALLAVQLWVRRFPVGSDGCLLQWVQCTCFASCSACLGRGKSSYPAAREAAAFGRAPPHRVALRDTRDLRGVTDGESSSQNLSGDTFASAPEYPVRKEVQSGHPVKQKVRSTRIGTHNASCLSNSICCCIILLLLLLRSLGAVPKGTLAQSLTKAFSSCRRCLERDQSWEGKPGARTTRWPACWAGPRRMTQRSAVSMRPHSPCCAGALSNTLC